MKKNLLLLILPILFLFNTTPVLAEQPTLCDRADMENYGVNKKWEITNSNINNVKITPCVDASEKIYDFQNVLTEEEKEQLKSMIEDYINKTQMDLVIVIDRIPYSMDETNEVFAADFYDYNDFGINFEDYSGTLLLRNTYEQDPYYDIYTFGEAQLYYDYDRLQIILDGIYDDLHQGNYLSGFTDFIDYLDDYYESGYGLKNYSIDENGFLVKNYQYPAFIIFGLSLLITIVTMSVLVKKNKMVMKATQAEEYLDQKSIHITNRQDQFLTTHTSSYTVSSSSGGSGGGGSHSGSSGGGHSSGGGRHG